MNWITFSQFIFAIGTILLIRKVFIKREILEGFDLLGAIITWVAMSFVLYQFYEWSDWIGLVAGFMQWGFWLFVIIFVALIILMLALIFGMIGYFLFSIAFPQYFAFDWYWLRFIALGFLMMLW